MAVAKLKRPKEDQFEELADRIATEINERATRMTPRNGPGPILKLRRLRTECSVVLLECGFDFLAGITPNF